MVVVLTLIMSVQIGHLYQVNEGYKQDEKTKQAQLKDEQERSTELQEKEAVPVCCSQQLHVQYNLPLFSFLYSVIASAADLPAR